MGVFRTKYIELNEKKQFNSVTVFTVLLTSKLVGEAKQSVRFIAKIQHYPKVGDIFSCYKKGTIILSPNEVDVRFDCIFDDEELQLEVWLLLGVQNYLKTSASELSQRKKLKNEET